MKIAVITSENIDDKAFVANILDYTREHTNSISLLITRSQTVSDRYVYEQARSNHLRISVQKLSEDTSPSTGPFVNDLKAIKRSQLVIFIWDGEEDATFEAISETKQENKDIWIFPSWSEMTSAWHKGKTDYKRGNLQKRLMQLDLADNIRIPAAEHLFENH